MTRCPFCNRAIRPSLRRHRALVRHIWNTHLECGDPPEEYERFMKCWCQAVFATPAAFEAHVKTPAILQAHYLTYALDLSGESHGSPGR